MAVYAVVPVKKLEVAKKRLSRVLKPQERKLLTLAMLEDVLTALKDSKVDETVVIGENSVVAQLAEKFGGFYLPAEGADLNGAIEKAQEWCIQKGADSVLVLPADLPLLDAADINRILELGAGTCVVLAPSQDWGTNAFYQNPPKQTPACFGPQSFLRHIKEAHDRGISVRLHFSAGLAADIDCARDLKKVFTANHITVTRKFLEQIKPVYKSLLTIDQPSLAEQKIKG